MSWELSDVSIGDYLEVEVTNPRRGDCNLDGGRICGKVFEIMPCHNQVFLDTGRWVCPEDKLIKHDRQGISNQ